MHCMRLYSRNATYTDTLQNTKKTTMKKSNNNNNNNALATAKHTPIEWVSTPYSFPS